MNFNLHYHPQVKKDLRDVPEPYLKRIKSAIENKIATDPTYYGVYLKGSLKPCFKFRIGPYRIVYDVKDNNVTILIVGHRREVYGRAGSRKGN